MLRRQFEVVWNQLRPKKPQMPHYLESVSIAGLRGIRDLRVQLPYPVSVLAGPNGCGKSTVLFALACAYPRQEGGVRRYPSDVFPNFLTRSSAVPSDEPGSAEIGFVLLEDRRTVQLTWTRRGQGRWRRRPEKTEPRRTCYFRTLADLTNPSEIRSVLQMGRQQIDAHEVSAALLAFAQRILPNRYSSLVDLSTARRDLLFAKLEDGSVYSEFHMASGERVVLRLSREISQLRDALVLIDEVDVGLHPFTQQQFMLELQRLALRNSLQLVVNTHSPVVLESVPEEGRIFLEREEDNVVIRPGWRDILQRAMYGRPLDRLHVLCEDHVAKAIVQGVLDSLSPELNLSTGDLDIGHDTGKDEFAHHVRAIARFQQLTSFVFVLDGDGGDLEPDLRGVAAQVGQVAQVLILPGPAAPEGWVWDCLVADTARAASLLSVDRALLEGEMDRARRVFEAATDKPSEIAKNRLATLLERIGHDVDHVCRVVARAEADNGSLVDFRTRLHDAINLWRSGEA